MLNDVMTLEEAAERWEKSTDSLRQACISRNGKPPRFEIGVEARQSKRIWLVTRQGMERLYGGVEYTIGNLTNIKACLIRMKDIINQVENIDDLYCQDIFNNIYRQLLSYELPKEISDVNEIEILLKKKDGFKDIKGITEDRLEWVLDELAGVHRDVFKLKVE